MKKIINFVLLGGFAMNAQANSYHELMDYVNDKYGKESEIYYRTEHIIKQFEKEARARLPEITLAIHQQHPELVVQFSNANCGVLQDNTDFMPFCTYIFTTHIPRYNAKGIVYGLDSKHTYCAVPISMDFKLAVNYTWDYVYYPAIQAGIEPNLLEYPPAGDPTQKAIQILQTCLESTFG